MIFFPNSSTSPLVPVSPQILAVFSLLTPSSLLLSSSPLDFLCSPVQASLVFCFQSQYVPFIVLSVFSQKCKFHQLFSHLTNEVLLCLKLWDDNHERQMVPSPWSLYREGSLSNYTNLTPLKILQWLPIAGLKSSVIWTNHPSGFISLNSLCSSHTSCSP